MGLKRWAVGTAILCALIFFLQVEAARGEKPGGGGSGTEAGEGATRPAEVAGGLPQGMRPQGPGDLRRTREELYGRSLSDDEHDRISSWRTWDPEWWMSGSRAKAARDEIKLLDQSVRSVPSEQVFHTVRSEDLLGIGLEVVDGAFSFPDGSRRRAVVLSFDARTRPDLISFHEVLLAVVKGLREEDGGLEELLGGSSASTLSDPTSDPMSGRELKTLLDAYLISAATLSDMVTRAAGEAWDTPEEVAHLTQSAFLELADQLELAREEVLSGCGQELLDRLPEDLRERLVEKTLSLARTMSVALVVEPQETVRAKVAGIREAVGHGS